MDKASAIDKSLRRGTYFKEERYLSADNIETRKDTEFFYFRAKCHASTKKAIHEISLALNKSTGDVAHVFCTCPAGKGGLDNHSGALLQEVASYSLQALHEVPNERTRTSQACVWSVRSSTHDIPKRPIMDMKISTIKEDKRRPGISCTLYEARDTPTLVNPADTVRLQQNLEAQDHLIPWALSITPDDEKTPYVTTPYGPAPIGSLLSHQFTVTEWSFKVFSNLCTVQRTSNQGHMAYPNFPLTKRVDTYSKPSIYPLTETQEQIVKKITISHEETVNIEKTTRQQATDKEVA